MMENNGGRKGKFFGRLSAFLRKCMFNVLSIGPIPDHIAFIMDGNRRYAKKHALAEGAGHKAGYSTLMSLLHYCYELGVKYVTVYAFSIDNFKRRPEEVKNVMDLMLEKIEGLLEKESIVNHYGIRVYFIGNLKLLDEPVRVAAEKAMMASAKNTKAVLLICVAYTSCDEIVHAVQESCKSKINEIQAPSESTVNNNVNKGIEEYRKVNGLNRRDDHENYVDRLNGFEIVETDQVQSFVFGDVRGSCNNNIAGSICSNLIEQSGSNEKQRKLPMVKLVDIEKHMYMAVVPDPDILIRSSGATRLSNFLLWQTANCPLYSPTALWPELGLWHLVWAVLIYQRSHKYLEKKRKQL